MSPPNDGFPAPAGQMIDPSIAKSGDSTQEAVRSSTSSAKDTQRTDLCNLSQTKAKPIAKQVARAAPKDAIPTDMGKREPDGTNGTGETDQTKQRNQYYGNAFAYRGPQSSIRDLVHGESIITAELKTNVIVDDEYTFMTDFSDHLAQRFQRPTTSTVISLDHSACLIFAGSFAPAYILTITALPSQVQSTTNKRNVALVQGFIAKALNIPATRGVIRFIAVTEDNLGTRGVTVLGEIENMSKPSTKDKTDDKTKSDRKATHRRRTSAGKQPESKNRSHGEAQEKSVQVGIQAPPIPEIPTEKSGLNIRAERVQKMGKRKSFLQMFGK